MDRFLRIRIWKADGSAVEYDNDTDTFWGIDSGTADLDQIMMQNELSYGEVNSAMFQVRVYGLDKNVKLNGRRIVVTLEYQRTVAPTLLVDNNNNPITTETGNYIVTEVGGEVTVYDNIFDGIINSSESDIIKTDRNIIAYDRLYTERDVNIADWWNTYWKSKIGTDVTLATFRSDLISHMYLIPSGTSSFINDSAVIPNPFQSVNDDNITYVLTFGDVLGMICKLQNCTPRMTGSGGIEFVTLGTRTFDIQGETEGLNSTWKDFETEKITGVAFYGDSVDPIRVVGTTTNVYNIAGNLLSLNMTTAQLDTIGTAILNDIKDIQYVPSYVHMKISRPEFKLGDKIITDCGISYIMQQTLSGSLMVEQELDSVATEATLNKDVVDYNDIIMQANKTASIEKEISDNSAEIVLKADANGRIVQVALGANASTGSSFSVKADDIAFISNGKMDLQASSLSISAGLTSMSDTSHTGVFLSTDGLYVRGSSGNYFKADKNGNINASGINLDTLYFNNPSSGALVQLSMTGANSYAQLSNLTITNNLTINSGKSLNYRGTELQSLLDAKKNSSAIHTGTISDCTFTNGEAHIPFSAVGVSSKPNGLVITPQYLGYVVVTYMWDLSSSQIVLYAWACDTGGGYGEWYNGSFRFSYVCIT